MISYNVYFDISKFRNTHNKTRFYICFEQNSISNSKNCSLKLINLLKFDVMISSIKDKFKFKHITWEKFHLHTRFGHFQGMVHLQDQWFKDLCNIFQKKN